MHGSFLLIDFMFIYLTQLDMTRLKGTLYLNPHPSSYLLGFPIRTALGMWQSFCTYCFEFPPPPSVLSHSLNKFIYNFVVLRPAQNSGHSLYCEQHVGVVLYAFNPWINGFDWLVGTFPLNFFSRFLSSLEQRRFKGVRYRQEKKRF